MLLMPTELATLSCMFEKTISLVFLVFIDRLITNSQLYNLFVSLFGLATFFSEVKIVVSSAFKYKFQNI